MLSPFKKHKHIRSRASDYQTLPTTENQKTILSTPSRSSKISIFGIPFLSPKLGLTTLILAALAISIIAIVHFGSAPPSHKLLHCGNSPTEARANGCVYSLVDVRWVPGQCYDKKMDDEFNSLPWHYFADKNGTREITQELAKQGDTEFWVTMEYHITHCEFTMRQLRRRYLEAARRSPQEVVASNTYMTEEEHFEHCVEYMNPRKIIEADLIVTFSKMDFGTCQVPL